MHKLLQTQSIGRVGLDELPYDLENLKRIFTDLMLHEETPEVILLNHAIILVRGHSLTKGELLEQNDKKHLPEVKHVDLFGIVTVLLMVHGGPNFRGQVLISSRRSVNQLSGT